MIKKEIVISSSPFTTFASYLQKHFKNPVQKISLNIGNSCPNRDGTKGYGGCTYCNIDSFTPHYCNSHDDLKMQIENGIAFFGHKKKEPDYLAYFQAYSNTYSDSENLIEIFESALNHQHIKGLIIGTRPDCLSDSLITYLTEKSNKCFVAVELGIESTSNKTLTQINRCHTFEETILAFDRLKNKGIHIGGHLILGLPGEDKSEMIQHAKKLSNLPLDTLKLHHLQIVKQTVMAHQYKTNPTDFQLLNFSDYVDLVCEFLSHLKPEIAIERFISQSPKDLLIAPDWGGIKNYQIPAIITNAMITKKLVQGMHCFNA